MSILRIQEAKKHTGHRSNASIYNAVRNGLFTKPVRIGQRAVGWPDYEVIDLVNARIAGKSSIEILRLVHKLHANCLTVFAFVSD